MCVICDRALPGLEESGWTDGEVTVCLGDRASVGVGHGEAMPESGWHPLPPQCGCEGLVAGDGTVLRLALAPSASGECGAAVRQAVPFAAILQGRVTLHAAAIACGGDIAAFTGASGSGKSRLAATLAGLGVRLVADDLLPCPTVSPLSLPKGVCAQPTMQAVMARSFAELWSQYSAIQASSHHESTRGPAGFASGPKLR